ncbi:MAG: cytochrome P450, partial [Cyclobacteriaceae bacterium]
ADTRERMNNKQLTDEVLTFFLAGHETTAVSAFWTIWLLLENPAKKIKLEEEISHLTTKDLQLSDLEDLPYLEAVIKEAMRLMSPVWVLGREAIADDKMAGFDIRRGDSIIFSPYMIHRHVDYWEEPDLYSPERFLDGEDIPKNAYFPFGTGPRLCIGNNFAMLELKVIIFAVFSTLNLHLEDDSFPGFDCSLTLRPAQDRIVSSK